MDTLSQPKTKKRKETDVQLKICEYLEEQGRCFFRMNNIPAFNKLPSGKIIMRKLPKFTPRGLPDIVVVAGGLFFALEVKRAFPKTYQSKDQKIFEVNIKKHGGRYHVVRCVEDVKTIGL